MMDNGGEHVRTQEKLGVLGGSKGGTDSDGYEVGMVRARQTKLLKQQTSALLWN